MKRISVAVVGCGRVSKFHALAYQNLAETQLIAGVDIDPKRRNWFTQSYHVPTYNSLDELIDKDCPDLISLCTPSDLHFVQAKQIIESGINLIIEKPVCLTQREGNKLLELEKKSKIIISTCFQNRFNPAVKLLLDLVSSRKLGKILVGNICVRWFRSPEYYINHWHASKKGSGGGVLMTQAIHHIDLLRVLMGNPVEIKGFALSLRPYSEVEDVVVACIKYPSAVASIECSTVSYPKDIEASITIIAENGTIKVGGKSLNRIEYGFVGDKIISDSPNSEDPATVYGTNHVLLIKDVVDAISNSRPPAVSLSEGVKSVNLVNRIYQALGK